MNHSNESHSLFSVGDNLGEVIRVIGMSPGPSTVSEMNAQGYNELPMRLGDETSEENTVARSNKPKLILSKNQLNAINKFPSLIEFMGGKNGEKIAMSFLEKINSIIVDDIENNTKNMNKFAQTCVAEKQNIKAFFVGEDKDWACVVTAQGPFTGHEAIFYDPEEDASYVLRINNESEDGIDDVSSSFNKIHEFSRREE